jgi:hypothetical protein
MNRLLIALRCLWLTVAVGVLLLARETAWAETLSELVKRVKPAVVEIVALDRKASPMKFGTGFSSPLMASSSLIVT